MASPLVHENIWFEKTKYEAAERQYYERLAKALAGTFSLENGTVLISTLQASMKADFPVEFANSSDCSAEIEADVLMTPYSQVVASLPPQQLKEEKRSKKEKRNKNKDKKRERRDQLRSSAAVIERPQVLKSMIIEAENPKLQETKSCSDSITCHVLADGDSERAKSRHSGSQGKASVDRTSALSKHQSCTASKGTQDTKTSICPRAHGLPTFAKNVCSSHSAERTLAESRSSVENKTPCVDSFAWGINQAKPLEKASSNSPMKNSLASEVAKARQHIKQSLECMDGIAAMAGAPVDVINRINSLEKENANLSKLVQSLNNLVISLENRVKSLEGGKPSAPAPVTKDNKNAKNKDEEEDDDGVDLFGSDSEEEGGEAAKVREARLAAYAAKKSKKPALIAKSNIILSVSPWDDETDMKKMEECVRTIQMDGLLWGASKFVPLAYGIHKLHISCVVEDDKVSVDLLQEKIQDFEDYVQSVDIAAFNKV